MKIKLIPFWLVIFAVLACNQNSGKKTLNNTCEVELKETKDKLKKVEDRLNEFDELQEFTLPIPDDINDQESIVFSDYNDQYTIKSRYKPSGMIDVKNDKIEIIIPVTRNELKIINYANISTCETNALLIVLDGYNGNRTPTSGITKVIKKQFKISKIGLDKNLLIAHKKLKVFVLHDNNFNSGHVVSYMKCISSNPGYNQLCFNINWPKYAKDIKDEKYIRPNEDDGDIIP